MQGRFDEAEELLRGFEDDPAATDAAVTLRLARGEPLAAARLLERAPGSSSVARACSLPRCSLGWWKHISLRVASATHGRQPPRSSGSRRLRTATGSSPRRCSRAGVSRPRRAAADAESLIRDAVNRYAALGLRLDAARLASSSPVLVATDRRRLPPMSPAVRSPSSSRSARSARPTRRQP